MTSEGAGSSLLINAMLDSGANIDISGMSIEEGIAVTLFGSDTGSVIGGSGVETITGGIDGNLIDGGGGADSIFAFDGNDTIVFSAGGDFDGNLNAGGGTDLLDVTASTDFTGASSVASFEILNIAGGQTATFLGSQVGAWEMAGNGTLEIDASAGGTIDLSVLTDNVTAGAEAFTGAVIVDGGVVAMNLTGSIFADDITARSGDTIDGGAGNDTATYSNVTGSLDISNVSNVEDFVVTGTDVTFTLANGIVDTGETRSVDLTGVTGNVNFDANTDSSGTYSIDMGTGMSAQDTVIGGRDAVGTDVLTFDGGAGTSTNVLNNVQRFERIDLTGNVSVVALNTLVAANATLIIDGSAAATLNFNGTAETNSHYRLTGGVGNDTLVGGSLSDTIDGGTGNDTINARSGDDVINMGTELSANDSINGGAGSDTLTFTDTGVDGTDLNNVTNVEYVTLGDATTAINAVDTLIALTGSLTIDGSALTGAHTLNFDGHLESAGSFNLIGGDGADTLYGGAGKDSIFGDQGSDILRGFGGADTISGLGTSNNVTVQVEAADRGTVTLADGDTLLASSGDLYLLNAGDRIALGDVSGPQTLESVTTTVNFSSDSMAIFNDFISGNFVTGTTIDTTLVPDAAELLLGIATTAANQSGYLLVRDSGLDGTRDWSLFHVSSGADGIVDDTEIQLVGVAKDWGVDPSGLFGLIP